MGDTETTNFFGYLFEENRTDEQNQINDQLIGEMPNFQIVGSSNESVKKVAFWDITKKANGGNHLPNLRQVTGACVGFGGGGAVWDLLSIEIVKLGQNEGFSLPFFLLPYGRSRLYGGLRGRGEGSFGSSFAKAIKEDGIVENKLAGLPQPTNSNGLVWGRNTELDWSDGARISEEWLSKSRKHPVQTTARIRSADEARAAIQNYYPMTIASMWGGMMQPPTQGSPAVRLNRRVTQWAHQMRCNGWWEHPSLGEIFYILNSWGENAHGSPASDEPSGGFWISREDMDWICRTGECFAFSQFQGFPGQNLDWLI